MPTIFIWGFTKPGTDNNVPVAYNYGQGPKVHSQSSSLSHMLVPVNTSALVIEELQKDAEGMYTCQALYDTDDGNRITFYFTRLDVEDWWSLSVSSLQKCPALMSTYKIHNHGVHLQTICFKELLHTNNILSNLSLKASSHADLFGFIYPMMRLRYLFLSFPPTTAQWRRMGKCSCHLSPEKMCS